MKIFIIITIISLWTIAVTHAELCMRWNESQEVGLLDKNILKEASGIEVSSSNKTLYHINDSGNGIYFYTSNLHGSDIKPVSILGYESPLADFEDLSVGPCYSKACIFIGDIGDNTKSRKYIKVIIIEEKEGFESSKKPLRIIRLKYPDRPHDAESLAIHPNGDLFIITKEANYKRKKAFPSKIYRVKRDEWQSDDIEIKSLELIGSIDIMLFNDSYTGFFDNLIASFDISSDGKRFVVLTYQNAYEFNIDLSIVNELDFKNLIRGEDYNTIKLKRLPQQESTAYFNSDKSILYNTEYKVVAPKLLRVDCETE